MYAVTISMRAVDAAGAAVLRQASLDVLAPSRAEPACLFFDALFDESDPLVVRFYEAYTDEAGYRAHFETPHLQAWQAACVPVLDRSSIRMPETVSDHGPGFTP
jgi:autoinducer 2-degrading protein